MTQGSIQSLLQQALASHRQGQFDRAESLYADILGQAPDQPQALHLLATLKLQLGQAQASLELTERAMTVVGRQPELLLNRSSALLALDRPEAAATDAQTVTESNPDVFGAWLNLGLARIAAGQSEPAREAFVRALALRPDDPRCQLEWRIAVLDCDSGQYRPPDDALVDQADQFPEQFAALLNGLMAGAKTDEARRLARRVARALTRLPERELDWLRNVKNAGLAITALELGKDLIDRAPSLADARLFVASACLICGDAAAAGEHYRQLLKRNPTYWQAHSNYLIALQHDPAVDADQIARAHIDWNRAHAPAEQPLPVRAPGNPLTIGWLTPRLLAGPMVSFFLGVLRAMPRQGVRHVLYQTHASDDASTQAFIAAADGCVRVADLDDEALVERIRSDQLDLAVDLSGHGPHHRLRAFARRLAPVQVSWLDYFHPTGVGAIDHFLTDQVLSPDAQLTGTGSLIALPAGRLCYSPPVAGMDTAPLPTNRIRFGSFNRIAKIGDPVLQAWAGILRRCPGAELELRSPHLDDLEIRAGLARRAGRLGLPLERVRMIGWRPVDEVLNAYRDIDVALDAWPYSGCATSADALWMGVPVITLAGTTMVSRQTASLLHHAGLDDWIASDQESYVRRACELATTCKRDAEQRWAQRQQFLERVGNCQRFAADLETTLIRLALEKVGANPHLQDSTIEP
jgi:protein O-GlcNAc transferase